MATKKAKKVTKKELTIDFTNSVEKIKGTAKTINNEVLNTATEVIEDLRTNGTVFQEVATAKVKEAIELISVQNGVKFAKETAQKVNKYSLETAEEALEIAVKGGKQWQGVAEKAVKGGFELAEKQQEMTFEVLETLKGQFTDSAKRFGRLFRNN